MTGSTILVTGAAGYIGRQVMARLGSAAAADTDDTGTQDPAPRVIGGDIRDGDPAHDVRHLDVTDAEAVDRLIASEDVTHVVHLAAVLESSGDRARDHAIDVGGTRNVIEACVRHGVRHLTVTSSGAAYGYHADNPVPLTEDAPLRGNVSFAYADHKRQVEGLLADARRDHPALAQLVLRVGTVLGPTMDNQITALLDRPVIPAVRGATAPFVFIADTDLVEVIARGVLAATAGIFNVAGEGTVRTDELAAVLGKRVAAIPAAVLRAGLGLASAAGVGRYGPEQVDFLAHRPVLEARRLREAFPGLPRRTSMEALEWWASTTGRLAEPPSPAPGPTAPGPGVVALVTGAAGGLGRVLVDRLVMDGVTVVATDLREPATPPGGSALAADLTDPTDVAAVAAHLRDAGGHLDLLIHCAGVTHRSPATTTDPDLLAHVMAVNWEGPMRLTHAVIDLLRPGGTIVGLSSMAGWMPVPGRAAYGASKAALTHHLEGLRPELASRDVNVLVVHPSFLDSVMVDVAGGEKPRTETGHPRSVHAVAGQIVQGIIDGRPQLFGDPVSRVGSVLWAVLPGLYRRVSARRFAAELPDA